MNDQVLGILLLAVLIDILIGDPKAAWHPVALIGRLIESWERLLYPRAEAAVLGCPFSAAPAGCLHEQAGGATTWRPVDRAGVLPGDARLIWLGVILVLGTTLPVWFLAYLCLAWLRQLYVHTVIGGALPASGYLLFRTYTYYLYLAVSALFLWSTISIRSLDQSAREILGLLRRGDLTAARNRLSLIVGRDTGRLEAGEIARAVVETVAENISDGVIAPLFYFLLGGVPLACAYRAVNTLDSMVGYRDERYRDFGMAAARLDDLANFLPARLTALLLVGGALLLGLDWRRAWHIAWRDGAKHPSPNSGYPEAAVAGALGVQLGGLNYYQGRPSLRPRLGEPAHPMEAGHIVGAVRLLHAATALFLALFAAGYLLWLLWGAYPR